MRPVVHIARCWAQRLSQNAIAFSGPAEAALEQRVLRVLIEISQHGIALVARNADDVVREAAVDVERLLSRDRMRANDRMLGARICRLVGNAGIRIKPAIDRFARRGPR